MFEAAASLDPSVPKRVLCESMRVCIRGHVRVCVRATKKQGVCVSALSSSDSPSVAVVRVSAAVLDSISRPFLTKKIVSAAGLSAP